MYMRKRDVFTITLLTATVFSVFGAIGARSYLNKAHAFELARHDRLCLQSLVESTLRRKPKTPKPKLIQAPKLVNESEVTNVGLAKQR